jgi:uncharacterized protein YkwD
VPRLTTLTAFASSVLLLTATGAAAQAPLAHAAKRSGKHTSTHARHCGTSAARARAHGSHAVHCNTAKTHSASHGKRRVGSSSVHPAPAVARTETEAVTIAKVLATPCQNTQLTPEPATLPLVREAVLCLINTERAQNGKEPLKTDARLERAAESHGKEMIADDYFEHVAPSGLTPVERIRSTGYIPSTEDGYVLGENLAWGTLSLSTPQAIVKAWIASPEHLANILEGKYRDTGIDVEPAVPSALSEGVAGATYTQEFGVIVH